MGFQITKTFKFSASHRLVGHDGPCARLHGHNYRVDVTVAGGVATHGPKAGMVMDLADLKHIWDTVMEPQLDHRHLNETIAGPTTTEHLAYYIYSGMAHLVAAAGAKLASVTVYETDTGSATYTPD